MAIRTMEELAALNLPKAAHDQIARTLQAGQTSSPRQPGSRAKVARPEQDAGKLLIQWVDLLNIPSPWPGEEWIRVGEYFAHNANGGARTAVEAAILKGQGVRKGWPDYTLYIPCHGYHGAVLELKAENGSKPEADQLDILTRLETAGYRAFVAWGFDEAREQISEYLDIPH